MLMEGTGIYFWMMFFVFLIVYITVKVSIASLLKQAREKSYVAYIPIYTTYYLVNFLGLKKRLFYFSLIPFVNLYFLNIIIQKLLEDFQQDPKQSIWFIIFPMYKFPELAFKKPVVASEYDLTKEFIETQNILFEQPKEELPDQINLIDLSKVNEEKSIYDDTVNGTVIAPSNYEQVPDSIISDVKEDNVSVFQQNNNPKMESVFNNQNLEPDRKHVTYVEATPTAVKEEKPIVENIDGRPKVCPNCGAKLSPSATTCFLCGRHLG